MSPSLAAVCDMSSPAKATTKLYYQGYCSVVEYSNQAAIKLV
jgi:hypothetical protein